MLLSGFLAFRVDMVGGLLGFVRREGGWLVGGYVYLVFIDPSGSKLSEDRICGRRRIHKVCSTGGGEREEGLKRHRVWSFQRICFGVVRGKAKVLCF